MKVEMKVEINLQELERGTYARYQTPQGLVLEVFQVTSVSGDEKDPFKPGKFYINGLAPVGPFDSVQAALESTF